jgi:hypothetical protein
LYRFEKWRDLIGQANSPTAVQKVIRQYVDCILPSEAAKLPTACQEVLQEADGDIATNAVSLLQEELRFTGSEESAALLHEIAHTFVAASTRLTQMQGLYPNVKE